MQVPYNVRSQNTSRKQIVKGLQIRSVPGETAASQSKTGQLLPLVSAHKLVADADPSTWRASNWKPTDAARLVVELSLNGCSDVAKLTRLLRQRPFAQPTSFSYRHLYLCEILHLAVLASQALRAIQLPQSEASVLPAVRLREFKPTDGQVLLRRPGGSGGNGVARCSYTSCKSACLLAPTSRARTCASDAAARTSCDADRSRTAACHLRRADGFVCR
jgi:hypothetical protein